MTKHLHTNANGDHSGFTLVELLVVISIIAMLAGLLLPAINAARENGRRIQCVSNQRQVAFALLNFEQAKRAFPPLRGPLRPSTYPPYNTNTNPTNTDLVELSWVGFLLPFMEHSTAWAQISAGNVEMTLYDLVIPVTQCRSSSSVSPGDNRLTYVVNAGPLNFNFPDNPVEFYPDPNEFNRSRRNDKMYTIFFDHFAWIGTWADFAGGIDSQRCETRVTLDEISSMDGTSMTILLSENEDAGHWIWYEAANPNIPQAVCADAASHQYIPDPGGWCLDEVEQFLAFCVPNAFASGEIPIYESPLLLNGAPNNVDSPLFINEGKNIRYDNAGARRTARPSSGHPGGVVTAFCDNGVRFLRDDIDKTLFVRLARPGNDVIINPKDLGW